ncbi:MULTISPECIES: aldo/keto reductase [unclassified Microbulbifer]|uniref:aldo/keto reductase n=1 Tax=unclassified Microbulbifer TaxID=2619833 RepID=UPI0027E5AC86|nr:MULTISPECIES: aldo/keto reductase [unclassified Microbulbifer]
MKNRLTRRQTLQLIGTAAALPPGPLLAGPAERHKKPIPGTEQRLPVIGMGTWRTFNVGSDPLLLDARTEVVRAFFQHGGGLIDSSPMYGSAPDVMGYALKHLGKPASLFSAEKVWSPGPAVQRGSRWLSWLDAEAYNASTWYRYTT